MNQPASTERPAATPSAAPAHRFRGFALRLGLGVAVIAVLLWHFDARPVFAVLRREQLSYFAATVALYVAGQVMSAYRWKMVAAILNLHGRFVEFVTYYFVGMFTNLFVPGLVGGDAARAIYLGRAHGRMGEAVASAIADRGLGLLALFWLAALSALFLNDAPLPQSVIVPTVAIGGVALAGLLAAPFIARLIHLMPRPIRRAGGIVAPYLHHPATLLPAIALSFVLQVSLAVCQYLLARGLGLGAPLSLFLLCVPIANVFASVPLTLNGLGIRESAYLVLFGMAGMAKDDAIALGLLWFASTMLGGLTGAIAFASAPARAVVTTSQAAD